MQSLTSNHQSDAKRLITTICVPSCRNSRGCLFAASYSGTQRHVSEVITLWITNLTIQAQAHLSWKSDARPGGHAGCP